jgi:hypothetical protein
MAKKKKKKPDPDELDEVAAEVEPEEESLEPTRPLRRPASAAPRNDVYVLLLAITFLSLVVSCVLMYMDAAQYEGKNPPQAAAPTLPELGKAGPVAPKQ